MAIQGTLLNNVAVKEVIKEVIHLHNVGVIQEQLDLKLSDQLLHHSVLLDLPFRHDLDCTEHSCRLFNGQHDATKGSLSEFIYDLEVVD